LWVYQTDVFPGYYIYSGAEWVRVAVNSEQIGKVVYDDNAGTFTTGGYTGYTVTNPIEGEFNVTFDTPFNDIPTVLIGAESVPPASTIDPTIFCPIAFSANCVPFGNADYLNTVNLQSLPGGVFSPAESFSDPNTGCNNTLDNYVDHFFAPNTIEATIYGVNTATGGSAGSNFNLQLSSGQEWLDNLFAWIDWNRDGDFEDAQEIIFEHYFAGSPSTTNNPIWDDLITEAGIVVPPTALNGENVLRTISRYSTTVPDPCLNATFGETHDYKITILGATAPSGSGAERACDCAPSDITASGFKVNCAVVTSDLSISTSFDFYATEH